ncbi:hypothetical protein CISG_01851 [Coccidioides immitis RMSCC 3703]|uniref:Uncharacterized protein n=2 Tax=Coccidioides immitis TaxID=5501 RepID=A0A0J8R367_COCIT|nr:hypothetical protein CIRG_08493 [Coccidioides immitis RMSCC 2394]KMU78810.1 hypothetical protein CISG_01851 [Coccidioides immitis RMSCC 3703]
MLCITTVNIPLIALVRQSKGPVAHDRKTNETPVTQNIEISKIYNCGLSCVWYSQFILDLGFRGRWFSCDSTDGVIHTVREGNELKEPLAMVGINFSHTRQSKSWPELDSCSPGLTSMKKLSAAVVSTSCNNFALFILIADVSGNGQLGDVTMFSQRVFGPTGLWTLVDYFLHLADATK